MYSVSLISILLLSNIYLIQCGTTLSESGQLSALVDQVNPEITTYLQKSQISSLFKTFAILSRNLTTVEQMTKGMAVPVVNALTETQKQQLWDSVQKAQTGLGGYQNMRIVFFRGIDAVQELIGDAVYKDRADITAQAKALNASPSQVNAMIYQACLPYFNYEFGQKVMDAVKYSMTKEDWLIVTADASKYMTVSNFNFVY